MCQARIQDTFFSHIVAPVLVTMTSSSHIVYSEKVCMSDGGHVCLDWFNERGSAPDCSSEGAEAIILMLPGTTGTTLPPLFHA